MSTHAVIWLDHEQAKVFFFDKDTYGERDFHSPKHALTSHAKHNDRQRRGESKEQKDFFEAIAKTLGGVEEILVLGPGIAKTELLKHLHAREPKLAERVLAVETADHPTPGQIVAHARHYFRAKDQLLGTAPLTH
jgi:stalled ribosome rescue protein Dom34